GELIDGVNVHLIRAYLRRHAVARFAGYRALAEAILAGDDSLAEAAALAAAGPGARLHGPRAVSPCRRATCALAEGPDP
ncbi:MAG TPA: hypothetical protein PKD10_03685, partial [Paracoccaceae bacterium]|nr:hypothetical protein [Paracoccaceae bacterium]